MTLPRPESEAPANPFCTRSVRPGAVPFLFPPGETAAALADRFHRTGGRAAIVGPHGSGKSTLLATLLPQVRRDGRQVTAVALHDGQRRLPANCEASRLAAGDVVVIDGYEQLGFFHRRRLCKLCRRRGLGLLVTSHGPVGLPVLFRTQVDLPLAQRIAARLQEGYETRVHQRDVARLFPQCGGNLRELLFALFDLYEVGQRTGE